MREFLASLFFATTLAADEIAFVANSGNASWSSSVYYTDSHGADPGKIGEGRRGGYQFDLSPDGGYLLYVTHTSKSFGEWYQIFQESRWGAPFRGEKRIQVFIDSAIEATGESIATPLYSPRWSPDGDQVLLARRNELIVLWGDKTTIPIISTSEVIQYCDWAPNERFVVSTQRNEIWIADDRSEQLLGEGFNPDVSPDGTRIVFLVSGDGGEKNIWTMNLDGGNKELIHSYVLSFGANGSHIAWSPDSSEIAFFNDEGIWAVSLDGTMRSILLTGEGVSIFGISWSPSWGTDTETAIFPTSWGTVKATDGR